MDEPDATKPSVETYFAPAARASGDQLRRHVEVVSRNPLIDTVMRVFSGLLAVLNPQRQILAVNDVLLAALGVERPDQMLGLRPGEAVQCIHAEDGAGGCGTGQHCASCGAVIAIVTSLTSDCPVERDCSISTRKQGKHVDLHFRVRCCSVILEGQQFLLLLLRDISVEQQRAALERVFYHDVSNLIENLLVNSRLLRDCRKETDAQELADQIQELTLRLANEVRLQKVLSRDVMDYELMIREIRLSRVLLNLERVFRSHPAAKGKMLRLPEVSPELRLCTDASLLERVLTNHGDQRPGSNIRRWRGPIVAQGGFRVDLLPRVEPSPNSRKRGTARVSAQFHHQRRGRPRARDLCHEASWRNVSSWQCRFYVFCGRRNHVPILLAEDSRNEPALKRRLRELA